MTGGLRSHVCVGVIMLAGLAGCPAPSRLLKATSSYATVVGASVAELGGVPSLVTGLCRERAELEYVLRRAAPTHPLSFDEFFAAPMPTTAPGVPAISWKQLCALYRVADDAFARGLAAIGGYGAALGELAGGEIAPSADLAALAKAAAADATKLSGAAKQYQPAIEGLGTPLGGLADALTGRWRAEHLREIVDRGDAPLHAAIDRLEAFLRVVRTEQLRDAREAAKDLLTQLDAVRQQQPGQRLDVVAPTMIAALDLEITHRLDAIEARVRALTGLLEQLAVAHTELKAGWDRGDDSALDTLKAMAKLARDAYANLKLFQHPPPGDGT